MQTFLAYSDFAKCAKVLDNKRLGKQRVECLQILQVLLKKKKSPNAKIAWSNHPAVKMWEDYHYTLTNYGLWICLEWRSRGYKDTCHDKILNVYNQITALTPNMILSQPPFIGNEQFHISHQSNLLRKDFNHYSQYFPNVPDNLPYQWYNPTTGEYYTIIK